MSAVTVYKGSLEDFPLPAQPSLTLSPLKKAEVAHRKKMKTTKVPLSVLGSLSSIGVKSIAGNFNNLDIHKYLVPPSRDFNSSLEEYTVTVFCDELIHLRRRQTGNKYILVPKFVGEYEIKVSVILKNIQSEWN
ncbi:hypothetical protein [Bacillus sp. OV322]|uniref:hypothetical protein n=1 Tax=Bacillus sp. OV322 TaxID=1882764 RepID=UPI000B83F94F|nr:hypothetical protein [Bacillus sp. OV322]